MYWTIAASELTDTIMSFATDIAETKWSDAEMLILHQMLTQ